MFSKDKKHTPPPARPKVGRGRLPKKTVIRTPEPVAGAESIPKKTGGNIVHDTIWMLMLIATAYLAFALATFHMDDPALSRTIHKVDYVHNWGGMIGAYLSDVGYYVVGLSVWWTVVAACVWLYKNLRVSGHTTDKYSPMIAGIGLAVLMFCSPVLERLLAGDQFSDSLPHGMGGLSGQLISQGMSMLLGYMGSLFLLLAMMAVGIKLLVQFSYRETVSMLWGYLKQSLHYLIGSGDHESSSDSKTNQQVASASSDSASWWSRMRSKKKSDASITDNQPSTNRKVAKSKEEAKAAERLRSSFPTDTHTSSVALKSRQTESGYIFPDVDLLKKPLKNDLVTVDEETLRQTGDRIVEKLAEFGIDVKVAAGATPGPVITRYEIELARGVKGSQIVNLSKDLARALSVQSVRVVETIPGKSTMGIELPNEHRQQVVLREILNSQLFSDAESKLSVALGKDIEGAAVVGDLAQMPHLLVGGMTGSGKSVGVNAMIMSILFKATPEEVRFVMIDPKMLELSVYEGIPHLLCPVVTDMKAAGNALNWCIAEMEKRYHLMSHVGVRSLATFNSKIREAKSSGEIIANPLSKNVNEPEPLIELPQIVIVIDELADLMMTEKKAVETQITRLAQKARAAGIHMIIATQRPSVDVVTGLIKANVPTRMAFTVKSRIDSRTILDQMGAEDLLKNGDLLFLRPGDAEPIRLQGAYVGDDEVHRVVDFIKAQREPDYVDGVLTGKAAVAVSKSLGQTESKVKDNYDELFESAVDFVRCTRKTSISSLQRHLRIGYNRAANLMQALEDEGIVSAPESNGVRRIYDPNTED